MADEKKAKKKSSEERKPAYRVDEENETFYLDMYRATQKEVNLANKYKKMRGFKVVSVNEKPKKKSDIDYSKEAIEAYLEKNGNATQKAEYKAAFEKIGEGKKKKAGFMGGLSYFRKTFKEYDVAKKA